MNDVEKETGFFREQWSYFKKGKNEINFMMNVYQTLILLFSISFLGDLPVSTILFITILFVVGFVITANRIGRYTAKKVDTSGFYVSPFFQDQTHYRINLLWGLMHITDNEKAQELFLDAININERWLRDDKQRI